MRRTNQKANGVFPKINKVLRVGKVYLEANKRGLNCDVLRFNHLYDCKCWLNFNQMMKRRVAKEMWSCRQMSSTNRVGFKKIRIKTWHTFNKKKAVKVSGSHKEKSRPGVFKTHKRYVGNTEQSNEFEENDGRIITRMNSVKLENHCRPLVSAKVCLWRRLVNSYCKHLIRHICSTRTRSSCCLYYKYTESTLVSVSKSEQTIWHDQQF